MPEHTDFMREEDMDHPVLLVKRTKDCVVLYTNNYLNGLGAEKLGDECDTLIGMGYRKIVINFENTELINSIGISILIGIIEKMQSVGGSLSFTNLTRTHVKTFDMLGLTKYVPVYEKECGVVPDFEAGDG